MKRFTIFWNNRIDQKQRFSNHFMQYMYQSRCLGSASLRRTVKWLLLLGRVKGVIYMCKFLPYRYRGTLSVWNPVSTAPPSPPHLEWVRGEFHGTFRKKRLVCVCVGVVGKRKTDATIGLNGWGREGNKTKHGTISLPPSFFLLAVGRMGLFSCRCWLCHAHRIHRTCRYRRLVVAVRVRWTFSLLSVCLFRSKGYFCVCVWWWYLFSVFVGCVWEAKTLFFF